MVELVGGVDPDIGRAKSEGTAGEDLGRSRRATGDVFQT